MVKAAHADDQCPSSYSALTLGPTKAALDQCTGSTVAHSIAAGRSSKRERLTTTVLKLIKTLEFSPKTILTLLYVYVEGSQLPGRTLLHASKPGLARAGAAAECHSRGVKLSGPWRREEAYRDLHLSGRRFRAMTVV